MKAITRLLGCGFRRIRAAVTCSTDKAGLARHPHRVPSSLLQPCLRRLPTSCSGRFGITLRRSKTCWKHSSPKQANLSFKSQLSEVRGLTNVCLYLLEPAARIGTVHDAPQVAQAFGYVASVIEDVFLGGPRIIGEENSHASRFGEDVGRMTEFGSLNDHTAL